MAKVTIPWGDGSGDNFYIDYTGVEGSSESLITSDINQTGVERRKTLVFRTTTSNVVTALQAEAYLTVIQKTDSLVVAMLITQLLRSVLQKLKLVGEILKTINRYGKVRRYKFFNREDFGW